ncbi:heat shock factor protein HSF24, putative [Medicago truncatula]|uniref:Heat shock factor protein HSF24, putative n=1 Tax=Medicago truncatula TaxID=3880 RepID=G7J6S7_MEDTR|nr:heat shock factor protein HSF24, putative [Medicago truncatula]
MNLTNNCWNLYSWELANQNFNRGQMDCPDLSSENKRLKKDNDKLTGELALAKKWCDKLVAFLQDIVNVGSDHQINRIIDKGQVGYILMMTTLQ